MGVRMVLASISKYGPFDDPKEKDKDGKPKVIQGFRGVFMEEGREEHKDGEGVPVHQLTMTEEQYHSVSYVPGIYDVEIGMGGTVAKPKPRLVSFKFLDSPHKFDWLKTMGLEMRSAVSTAIEKARAAKQNPAPPVS